MILGLWVGYRWVWQWVLVAVAVGLGDGCWWRWVGLGFVMGFSLFHNGFCGFYCVLQWVLMGSRVGWDSNGGGGLGILLMVVICVVVFG